MRIGYMDLSIGKLQHLVAVARCGSFSRAAAELNLSQPALSRSIAGIEQRYGFPIFARLGHGVEPTAAGAQVIAQALPLLQELRVFDSNLRLLGAGKAGTLAIGMAPLLASQFLPRLAAAFFEGEAQVGLRALIRPGPELLDALQADRIELFFFPESHVEPSADVEVDPIGTMKAACVVRAGHPLAGRRDLTSADLAPYPWASSVEAGGPPATPVRGRLTCDNYHVLRDTVLHSDLVFICSNAFVAQELEQGSLREIMVADIPLPPTGLYMAKLRGRVISPLAHEAARRMRGYLAETA
jgi:DNA-binding transcriptional LysR family regulator